jgi:acetyl esterase
MSTDPEVKGELDPQIAMLLQMYNSIPQQSDERDIATARSGLETAAALQYSTKEEMFLVEDGEIIPGISGRWYWPSDHPEGLVIYFHGGGFALGSLETHDGLVRSIARQSGALVLSVAYALAPEHRFPVAVDQAVEVVSHLIEEHQRGSIGVAGGIAVAGDSAGGTLAAVSALQAGTQSPGALAAQVLMYPLADASMDYPSVDENATGFFLTRDELEWFGQLYLRGDEEMDDPRISPLRARNLKVLPRTLILVAGFDPLRDQGIAFADALVRAGVDTQLRQYPSMIHGFCSLERVSSVAANAVHELAEYLRVALSSNGAR